ncbi:MAG: putative aminohydrolase SsnA [Spirochaetales bacterium]|nr:putative aminohydrolase SsnA [Spirochaetales bacterium]
MITVIKNVRVMQTEPPFEVLEGVDVVITDDMITGVGKGIAGDIRSDKVIEGKNRVLIPGNVCSHHHYYSGLARGMLISAGPQTDFIQVLKEWWWRLDRGLDEEACYYSSLICSLDAIAAGTTTCIDHHASPYYIKGSLSTIAKGMEEVGVRGATCYEVTDRNGGLKEVEEGVEENVRFAKEVDAKRKRGERVLCEAMIGGHAPFTIPDEGLEMMSKAVKETGRGMHLHCAEDKYDVIHSHHIYGKDIMKRLEEKELLSDKTLIVHGLFLNDDEIRTVNDNKCFFAHNGRSNMNNGVGYLKRICDVEKLVIGTDGCGGNMFEELKIAFFKHKDEHLPFWPADYVKALNRGNRLVETCFGDGRKWGRVEKGYTADLVLLNYHNPTPLKKENAAGHFVWGMASGHVDTVLVDGKVIMEDRVFPGIDVDAVYKKASEIAQRVWTIVDKIKA